MNIIVIVETFVAFMLAITLHEAAHAGMATLLGDSTAVNQGRLSLAPGRQMTTPGTLVAIFLSFTALTGIGWGRPMEVDAQRMRVGPNTGTILTALAGPALNLILGVAVAFGLDMLPATSALAASAPDCEHQFSLATDFSAHGLQLQNCLSSVQPAYALRLEQFGVIFAVVSIAIGLVNFIPLHPLDGYHILFALLPSPSAIRYRNWMPHMEMVLLLLFLALPLFLTALGVTGFNPGGWFAGWSNGIVGGITHGAYSFYQLL